MWKRLHVKCPLFLSNFNETWIFSTDFRKIPNIKCHKNPSIENRVVPCGKKKGRTDIKKLIVGFRNFAKGPKSVFRVYAMAQTGISKLWPCSFLISAQDEGEWLTLRLDRFTPWKGLRYQLDRRRVKPQSRSGYLEKNSLAPTGFRNPDRLARTIVITAAHKITLQILSVSICPISIFKVSIWMRRLHPHC